MSVSPIALIILLAPIAVAAIVFIGMVVYWSWQYRGIKEVPKEFQDDAKPHEPIPPAYDPMPEIHAKYKEMAMVHQEQMDKLYYEMFERLKSQQADATTDALKTLAESNNTALATIASHGQAIESHAKDIALINQFLGAVKAEFANVYQTIQNNAEAANQKIADTRPVMTAPTNPPRSPSGKKMFASVEDVMKEMAKPKVPAGGFVEPTGGRSMIIDGEESIEDDPEFEVDEIGRAIIPIPRPEPAPEPVMPVKPKRSRKKPQ